MKQISKKEELKKIWAKVAPNDDPEALNWYCENMLKEENDVLTIQENGKNVAAVGVVEAAFSYNGIEMPITIGGYLCVEPENQHKGYQIAIGSYYGRHCYDRGIDLIAGWEVSPKLRKLYESIAHFIYRDSVKKSTINAIDILHYKNSPYRIEITRKNIANEYNELAKKRYRNYMIHSNNAFELMSMEGQFFIAYDANGDVQGIAIRLFQTPDNYIEECITTNNEVRNFLLSGITEYYQWDNITYSEYGVGVEGAETSHGMLRVINAHNMLKRYAESHPEYEGSFTVHDATIIENNQTFRIHKGKCEVIAPDNSLKTMSILQLSELLFDGFYLNMGIIY